MKFLDFFIVLKNFIKKIYFQRTMIRAMAAREIQSRYIGTFGGFSWSLINPLMMILVYWFVFSVGFKIQPPGGVPFILVFLCGLVPWTIFNETLMSSTHVIIRNVHLVKKVVFPTEILPLVNLVAGLVTHAIMLIILVIVMWVNGVALSLYNLQFLYYLAALMVFTIGLGWLCSALNVFYRDVGQILGVLLNLWFWLTPIVWLTGMIPEQYQFYLKLNPLMYIVMGYKNSFIYHVPFWEEFNWGIYFWVLSLTVFAVGGLVFRKLKPEFSEVL